MNVEVRFLGGGAYEAPKGLDYPLHRHGCWELVFYREGHPECSVGDDWYQAHPGLLLCTPPQTPHMEKAVTAYSNYFIAVDASAEHSWPVKTTDDAHGSLLYIFRQLVTLSRGLEGEASPYQKEMVELLMTQLDLWLRNAYSAVPASHGERIVREVESLFEERFARPLQVHEVAEEIGVAPSALRAYFLKYRGYQPKIALRRVRLQRATALLRTSDLSLQQVATACGFYSPSHLTRHIKATTGIAPGQLRKD
jgi:AraC-like DNA-binding protein